MPSHASRNRARSAWRQRLRAWLRVAGFLSLVAGGLGYFAVRSAYAETERAILGLGRQLVHELGPAIISTPQPLLVNGERLFISSTQSTLSVREVLDQLAASCSSTATPSAPPLPWFSHPGSASATTPGTSTPTSNPTPSDPRPTDAAEVQALSPLVRTLLEDPGRLSILRGENAEEGQIACLAQPAGARGLSALLERAQEFVASGDLSRVGDVRYVAARKLASGKTHVIAVWSEGELRIGSLFPEAGDAAGTDMADVPRPPDSTRPLCAMAPGRSFGLRLYDSSRPQHEVVAFYERELPSRGWEPLRMQPEARALPDGTAVRVFSRAGHVVALGVDESSAGKTGISLIDMGAVGRSEANDESPFH